MTIGQNSLIIFPSAPFCSTVCLPTQGRFSIRAGSDYSHRVTPVALPGVRTISVSEGLELVRWDGMVRSACFLGSNSGHGEARNHASVYIVSLAPPLPGVSVKHSWHQSHHPTGIFKSSPGDQHNVELKIAGCWVWMETEIVSSWQLFFTFFDDLF